MAPTAQPDLSSLYTALQNADKAGDKVAATKIATYIQSVWGGKAKAPEGPPQPQPTNTTPTSPFGSKIAQAVSQGANQVENMLSPVLGGINPMAWGTTKALTALNTPSPEATQAAQQGIDVHTGAPYGLRNQLSVMVNPKPEDVVEAINQHFGKPVGSIGPMGPQFIAPNGRQTLVTPQTGTGLGAFEPTAGGALDATLPTAGAAVAGGLTGAATANPLAGLAATSVGAGAGQLLANEGKNVLSHFWNREPFSAAQQESDLKSAGSTTASTALFGAPSLAPSFGNFMNRGFSQMGDVGGETNFISRALIGNNRLSGSLQRVYNASINARNALQDFYELIGGSRFSPSVTELLPEEVTLGKQFQSAAKAGGVRVGGPFSGPYILDANQQRERENVNALVQAHQAVTDQYKPNEGYAPPEGAYEAAQQVSKQKAVEQNQALLARNQAFNEVKQASAGAQSRYQIGKSIMNALGLVKQSGLDAMNKVWGDLKVKLGIPPDEAYGGDPYAAPLGNMPHIGYTNVTKTKLTNLWQRGMSALRNVQTGTPLAGTSAHSIFDSIPDELYLDPTDPTQGLIFSDPTKEYSPNLKWYIDGIKGLRAGIRRSVRPGFNPDTITQKNVADILRDNVTQFFGREGDPSILEAWEKAEQATHDFHTTFNQGILKQADDAEAGANTPIFNQFATRVLMRGNTDELSRLADVTAQHPFAQNQMRMGIWSLIHEAVQGATNPGQVATKYKQMLGKLAPAITRFFNPEDIDKLSTFEGMTQHVDQLNSEYQDFAKNWKLGDFADTPASVPNITSLLYNKNMPLDRAAKLYGFLAEKNPELLGKVKADMASALADKMSTQTGEGRVPNLVNMEDVLGNDNNVKKIRLFLGDEHLNNLNAIKSATKVLKGPAAPEPEKPQSILTQVVRWAIAPPLSSEGRLYSGILFWRHRAAARAMYNALSSPEGLSDFINLAHTRYNNTAVQTTLGALRAGSLASQLPSGRPQQSGAPATAQRPGP